MKTTIERGEGNSTPLAQKTREAWGTRVDRIDQPDSWARTCATGGAAVWAGMAVLARAGIARIGAIELMFLFAPLVIVPLGIELGRVMGEGGWVVRVARRIQPVGAAFAVVAMWLPPGRMAGAVALGWMVVCVVLAGDGVMRIVSSAWRDADRSVRATWGGGTFGRLVLAAGRIDLAVGGAWLVASRLGMRPMGIQEPIGLLTAVHFHFAGFATATIGAATLTFAERRGTQRWLRSIVVAVVGLPYAVAAGFVIAPALKMAAAVLFSVSVAALAVALRLNLKYVSAGTARLLLQVASGTVFAGMVFAAAYAVADFRGGEGLTIPQMARTHGILNAVGFCLPGLLGWLVEESGA